MRKFYKEFKAFIARGNVIDLAVAVIIGGAFSAIVTALTNKIIMPIINWLLSLIGGKDGLSSAYTFLSKVKDAEGNIDFANSIYIDWGAFITAIIDFLLIALVLFTIIKMFNASRAQLKKLEDMTRKELKKEVLQEKKEIRAKAKAEGRKFKQVWAEHLAQKKQKQEEKERLAAEEKAKKDAEEKANNPSQEDLLKDILAELQNMRSNN